MFRRMWKAVEDEVGKTRVIEAERREEESEKRKNRERKKKKWSQRKKPRKEKVYLLSREEREEVHKFIDEQLRKGYIRFLKSPQTVPVFFVEKKDSKKCMVQNYWYLNKLTVKNNYSLSLISDIIRNIGTKKVFTKLDL